MKADAVAPPASVLHRRDLLRHRLLLAPTFLAETRGLSQDDTLALVRDRCFTAAPPPEPDWDGARSPGARPVAEPARD